MLDVMRRKKGLTRVILSFVVVAVAGTFGVALYGVWGGALTSAKQGSPSWIAVVDGEQIPAQPYRQRRANLLEQYRNQFGAQADDERMVTQAEVQAVSGLIGLYLARQEAEREGLMVTPDEVRQAIITHPAFQQGGRFVGLKRYQDFLNAQGLTPAQFESEVSQELAADKIRFALFQLAEVRDDDLDKRYRDEVEKVNLDYVLLPDSEYRTSGQPSDSEVSAYFDAHKDDYLKPEARRAAYVLFDREQRAATIDVPEPEMRDYYEKNKDTLYTHPEQRRASHILFKVAPNATPEEKEEARKKAEDALTRINGGEDFATVARETSEDSTTAPAGGDLGFFGRGRMVKEFEDAAFALSPGQVSGVVESGFGFHIIKVTEARPAGSQPFEEVRDEIRRTLAVQKAQQAISKDAEAFTTALAAQESSFATLATDRGLQVQDTGFVTRGAPIGSLGRLPQAEDALFSLAVGDTSPPVVVSQGLAVFKLDETKPPEPSPLDEVRDKVKADLLKSRAREKARAVAGKIVDASGTLADRTKGRKLEISSLPAVGRMQPVPPLTDAAKEAAFAAAPGAVLGPYESADGLVIVEVKSHFPSTPDEEAAQKRRLREDMLQESRSDLYIALMTRLHRGAEIQINDGLMTKPAQAGS